MKLARLPLAAILLVLFFIPAAGQPPGPTQPPRDPSAAPSPSSRPGAIRGRVVDAVTGAPIARATVRLSVRGNMRPAATSDDQGTFAFTGLEPGAYVVSVEKSTYLPGSYPENGRTLRTRMQPLTVASGQTVDGVTVRMYRGGVITGRILDAHGDPVEYADIRAMRVAGSMGRPSPAGSASANDIGEFRLARLQPGSYMLLALPRRMSPDQPPGEQAVATYYPGVAAPDQAQAITVERGTLLSGLDIVLLESTTSTVSGMLVDREGQPARGGAFINVRRVVKDLPFGGETAGTSVRPDGTFELRLAPGEYDLDAQYFPRSANGSPLPGEQQQFANARVSVAGQPMTGIVLALGFGATASGRFVFEGNAAPPPNLAQIRVGFSGPDGPGCRTGKNDTAADGTFTVEGLSGTCIVRMGGMFGEWTLKAVMHDKKNLLDEPLTFAAGQQLRDVQVIFTDRRTELTLNVADEKGELTREYAALVFPADQSKWNTEGIRYVRAYVPPPREMTGATNANGRGLTVPPSRTSSTNPRRDTVAGLPPGDYYVVAFDDLEAETVRDAALFERLRSSAERVTLTEGAPVELSLRRIKAEKD